MPDIFFSFDESFKIMKLRIQLKKIHKISTETCWFEHFWVEFLEFLVFGKQKLTFYLGTDNSETNCYNYHCKDHDKKDDEKTKANEKSDEKAEYDGNNDEKECNENAHNQINQSSNEHYNDEGNHTEVGNKKGNNTETGNKKTKAGDKSNPKTYQVNENDKKARKNANKTDSTHNEETGKCNSSKETLKFNKKAIFSNKTDHCKATENGTTKNNTKTADGIKESQKFIGRYDNKGSNKNAPPHF